MNTEDGAKLYDVCPHVSDSVRVPRPCRLLGGWAWGGRIHVPLPPGLHGKEDCLAASLEVAQAKQVLPLGRVVSDKRSACAPERPEVGRGQEVLGLFFAFC